MKLIIDIPEDVVTAIQNGQDYRYDIHTAIAQGEPYGTSCDLISREALKEAIEKAFETADLSEYEACICVSEIYDKEIDNAPTVEECKIIDGLNNEIDDLSENLAWYVNERNRLLKERQGKWIKDEEHSITINMFRCSNCNGGGYTHFKYCPHCGSRMGGKNDR